jgi:hypothetical protein
MTIKNRVEKLEQRRVSIPEKQLTILELGSTREPTEAEIAAYKESIDWKGCPSHIAYWNGESFSKGLNTDTSPSAPHIASITVSSEKTVDLLLEIAKGIEPHGEGEL